MGIMDTAAGVFGYSNFKATAEDIKFLQTMLNNAGVANPPLTIDGKFGPKTLAALNAWQSQNKLAVTTSYDGVAKQQLDRALAYLSGSTGGTVGNVAGNVAVGIGTTETRTIADALSGQPKPAPPVSGATKVAEGLAAGAKTAPPLVSPAPISAPSISSAARSVPVATGSPTVAPMTPRPNYANLTDGQIDSLVRTEFGALAWYTQVPELAGVIRGAIREGIVDPNVIVGRISQTDWWKQTLPAMRRWMQFVHESGGETSAAVQEAINRQTEQVATEAKRLGVNMPPDRARQLASDALKFEWTGEMLTKNIVADFEWKGSDSAQGQAGVIAAAFKQVASDYLVPISDATMDKWVSDALMGNVNEEMFRGYIAEQAKSLFPGLATAIDRGISVRQYVSPYVELAARELETSPDMIDLMDPKWSKPLFQIDKDGNPVQMSLAQWQTELRRNTVYGWQNTKAARAEAYETAGFIRNVFEGVA